MASIQSNIEMSQEILLYMENLLGLFCFHITLSPLSMETGVQFRFELWEYYEETFGKTSDMAPSDYLRITATNMKTKAEKKRKR